MTSAPSPRMRSAIYLLALVLSSSAVIGTARSASSADLDGCWVGRWVGCTDGRTGTVRARITKCGANQYHAVFRGRCFKIMPYRYTATLTAVKDDQTGRAHFKCTRKLPIWGWYWMNGSVNGNKVFARYRTDDHTGYFTMQRTCCRK
jgi:hypothetical protein